VQHLQEFDGFLSRLERDQLPLSDRVALASLMSDLRRIVRPNTTTLDQ